MLEDNYLASREACLVCGASLLESELYARHRICSVCRFHYSMTARERIASLADPGSFHEINRHLISLDPISFSSRVSYTQRLFRDQRRTGLTEAVVTGTCAIGGIPAMLIVLDFGFMGGSMGCVVGEKVALALEQAARRKLATIAIVTSGGARIEEGILSLMQMAKTVIAANQLHDKGIPFISVLANPATGQAYASFANLADIILAEPGAIVGFTPLRVIKETSELPLPHAAHTSESHLEHGLLDAVVDRAQLRELLGTLLDILGTQYRLTPKQKAQEQKVELPRPHPWNSVQLARHESRPTSLDYVGRIFTSFVELHGERLYGDDKSIVCGLGQLGGQAVVVIGQQRYRGSNGAEGNGSRTSPEGFRKAQRALRLASKFDMPLVTLIDTPGPDLSLQAENQGLGNAIAATIALIARLRVPTLSVIIGEGGNAGALALGVADRVLMMENAIYSTISPEEAAEVMFQDEARAEEAAESLRLTAQDCLKLGIVDRVVPEPLGGAHLNHDEAARQLRRILLQELAQLQAVPRGKMVRDRYKKFRNMGEYSSYFRAVIAREVNALQGLVATGVRRLAGRQPQKSSASPRNGSPGEDSAPHLG
jgi:acetyl-CoA carboxylase carboxyl transferase alpha subunit/acetyl-CoA carboxylase carboxyl transferase beta subunit